MKVSSHHFLFGRPNSPRLSQLMSDDVDAIASWGCLLTPVGGACRAVELGARVVGYALALYALLGARSAPQGLFIAVGSHVSWMLAGIPLEYPDSEAGDAGRSGPASILPAMPSLIGILLVCCETVGLPELTRLYLPGPSRWSGGTVAESCVILWSPE